MEGAARLPPGHPPGIQKQILITRGSGDFHMQSIGFFI
jgi:hypothetical protein